MAPCARVRTMIPNSSGQTSCPMSRRRLRSASSSIFFETPTFSEASVISALVAQRALHDLQEELLILLHDLADRGE